MGRQKPWHLPRRLEPLHDPLSSSGRLVGILRPVVEAFVLPVLDAGHDLTLGRDVAAELVGNQHARRSPTEAVGEFPTEFQAPLPDRLVADRDAASRQPLFDHAQAQREPEIQPDRIADELGGVAIASVKRVSGRRHPGQISDPPAPPSRRPLNLTVPRLYLLARALIEPR